MGIGSYGMLPCTLKGLKRMCLFSFLLIFSRKKVVTASLYRFRNSIVSVCCFRLTIFPCPLPNEFGTHFYSWGSHSYICCLWSDDIWAVTNDLVHQRCPGFLNKSCFYFSYFPFICSYWTTVFSQRATDRWKETIVKIIDNNNYLTLQ